MPRLHNLSIGALARHAGVQVQTIRYYEQEGLLPKAARSAGNYRLYGAADIERLNFIRRARELGFKLEVVRRLLDLSDRRIGSCDQVRALAAAHRREVRAKLADLRRMDRVLGELVRACAGGTVPDCALLQALAGARQPIR